jgi:hypothetical protein
MPQLPQPAHGFHPPEDLFDQFPFLLTDGIPRVTRSAGINRAALDLLRDVWRHPEGPHLGDKAGHIETLVAANGGVVPRRGDRDGTAPAGAACTRCAGSSDVRLMAFSDRPRPTDDRVCRWGLPVLARGVSRHAQGLRLRRVGRRLALAPPSVWPSVLLNDVGTLIAIISQLNTRPACAPVNASIATSRLAMHDSG